MRIRTTLFHCARKRMAGAGEKLATVNENRKNVGLSRIRAMHKTPQNAGTTFADK